MMPGHARNPHVSQMPFCHLLFLVPSAFFHPYPSPVCNAQGAARVLWCLLAGMMSVWAGNMVGFSVSWFGHLVRMVLVMWLLGFIFMWSRWQTQKLVGQMDSAWESLLYIVAEVWEWWRFPKRLMTALNYAICRCNLIFGGRMGVGHEDIL